MEAVALSRGFAPEPIESPGSPDWLVRLRETAFSRFEELGFPSAADEAWRYTGIQPITGTPWIRVRRNARTAGALPPGARLRRLTEVAREEVEPYLGRIAGRTNAFAALNTASLEDALVLDVAPGAVIADPIELVWESSPGDRPEVSHARLLILAGERSECSVVESYLGSGRYLQNAVTEIAVGPRALLSHYKLQRESLDAFHVHALAVRQERDSRFTSHNVAFGSALARTNIDLRLDAEGAECALNGLFVGAGEQHLDNHTIIDHAKPRCVSRELYKGILDGAARGVFYGKIIVRADAQKTDAIQTNKNLLLSRRALVNSTPALEILADDVKCKHGSTTGQLDAAALFYLRSRGIGEAEARALLTRAFVSDVVDRLEVPAIREAVMREMILRLDGAGIEGKTS